MAVTGLTTAEYEVEAEEVLVAQTRPDSGWSERQGRDVRCPCWT